MGNAEIAGAVFIGRACRVEHVSVRDASLERPPHRLNVRKDVGGIPNLPERFGKNAEKDNGIKEEFGLWRPVGCLAI